jgi:hypothetical protein
MVGSTLTEAIGLAARGECNGKWRAERIESETEGFLQGQALRDAISGIGAGSV